MDLAEFLEVISDSLQLRGNGLALLYPTLPQLHNGMEQRQVDMEPNPTPYDQVTPTFPLSKRVTISS